VEINGLKEGRRESIGMRIECGSVCVMDDKLEGLSGFLDLECSLVSIWVATRFSTPCPFSRQSLCEDILAPLHVHVDRNSSGL